SSDRKSEQATRHERTSCGPIRIATPARGPELMGAGLTAAIPLLRVRHRRRLFVIFEDTHNLPEQPLFLFVVGRTLAGCHGLGGRAGWGRGPGLDRRQGLFASYTQNARKESLHPGELVAGILGLR